MELAELESVDIVIEISGADEETADDLRAIFDAEDDDVIFSHAFGGEDVINILTKFGLPTLAKLLDYKGKSKLEVSKTALVIEGKKFTLKGFNREDLEALLANPDLQKMVKASKNK